MRPQLCQTTKEPVEHYLTSPQWAMQQKLDGERLIYEIKDGEGIGYNRSGDLRDIPRTLQNPRALGLKSDTILDGEIIGDTYYAFDLLGGTFPSVGAESRSFGLTLLMGTITSDIIVQVPLYLGDTTAKFIEMKDAGVEGVVFKRVSSTYKGGKSYNALKYKFTSDVDCIVTDLGVDGKDNMQLGMIDGDQLVIVGKCSALTGDGPRVKVGDVVKVNCLYVNKGIDGWRLYQPVKPLIRTDKRLAECTIDQLSELLTNKSLILSQ